MALRPIYEICDRETGYEGGGRRHDPWRRQTAAWKQLREMLEENLEEARARQQEYGSNCEGMEWEEVSESESGSKVYCNAGTETGDARVVR